MAGTIGNDNAKGNRGGKSLNDRILAAEVRNLTLKKILAIYNQPPVERTEKEYELYTAVLVKMAGQVLPRLTEVTGEDGGVLQLIVNRAGEVKKTEVKETNDKTNDTNTGTGTNAVSTAGSGDIQSAKV